MEDKRVHPRVIVNTPVSCELHGTSVSTFTGLAKDISIGGVFVESDQVVRFGTQITIVGRLPGTKADLRLPGIVRWSKPTGFGVQFQSLGARETHAISLLKR